MCASATPERRYLFLHGLNGSAAGHWQRWLAAELVRAGEQVAFPDLPDPETPDPDAWAHAARRELEAGPAPIVLCHSLSCLLWLRLAAGAGAGAALAEHTLLIAPPWREDIPEVVPFLDHGADADDLRRASGSTLMICSDDDPYCPDGALERFARPLALEYELVPGGAHLNLDAGYGPWPRVREWAFSAARR